MNSISKAGVITGDIISSANIKTGRRQKLLKTMEEALQKTQSILPDFNPEIFQGDSFQGYTVEKTNETLRAALYIILQMQIEHFGVRISTGIGDISFETGKSLTSDGTAFRQSGRNMEALKKKDQVIAIGIENEALHNEWEVHSLTLDFLLKKCSDLQAAAIAQMLEKRTQQEAADNLRVKQPAINQRLQAAGWPVFQSIISRFEMLF